jgi:hypothetical protein
MRENFTHFANCAESQAKVDGKSLAFLCFAANLRLGTGIA